MSSKNKTKHKIKSKVKKSKVIYHPHKSGDIPCISFLKDTSQD